MVGFMFLIMLGLIFIGVPVAFSILGSGIWFLLATDIKPLALVCQRAVTGLDSFPLLAVPLFVFVGDLMDRGGISKRMIRWAESLLVPSLVKNGYPLKTAAGMAAAGGALGPIIPPSIPMIIYGVTMGISIPKMFVAGIVPGLFLAGLLIIVNMIIAIKNPEILRHRGTAFSIREVLKNTWSALGALLLPIIILGGIYSGIFTPTESAAVGVVYALFVGIFVYKEIRISDIPKALVKSMETAAMVDIIIAAANLLSWIMSVTQASTYIIGALSGIITNKYTYLLVLMVLLFVVGALMDTVAAIIIIAPVIVPMGIELGLDPLHLGMIFVINLVIGYVTPPFGYNLFTAGSVTGLKFNDVVKGVLPFLLIEMAAVMILAYVPGIITWLPTILGS